MNKKMALILTTAAVMGLAGCSGQTTKTETTAASAAETTSEQTTQAKSEAAETTKGYRFPKDNLSHPPYVARSNRSLCQNV